MKSERVCCLIKRYSFLVAMGVDVVQLYDYNDTSEGFYFLWCV